MNRFDDDFIILLSSILWQFVLNSPSGMSIIYLLALIAMVSVSNE